MDRVRHALDGVDHPLINRLKARYDAKRCECEAVNMSAQVGWVVHIAVLSALLIEALRGRTTTQYGFLTMVYPLVLLLSIRSHIWDLFDSMFPSRALKVLTITGLVSSYFISVLSGGSNPKALAAVLAVALLANVGTYFASRNPEGNTDGLVNKCMALEINREIKRYADEAVGFIKSVSPAGRMAWTKAKAKAEAWL